MTDGRGDGGSIYGAEESVRDTLAIEQRLRDLGYANLPELLRSGGDFEFQGSTVEAIVEEASKFLLHQASVDLAGARILATIGELAVKAQAFEAVAALVRKK